MFTRIGIGGFKSYATGESAHLAPLSVMIGANASGKSNFIEAMHLLGWLATGHRLNELTHALREQSLLIRGRPDDLSGDNEVIRFVVELSDLRLTLGLRMDAPGPRIVEETLEDLAESGKHPLYRVEQVATEYGNELEVAYNNFAKGKNKPRVTCVDQQPVFSQLLTPARFNAKHEESQRRIPEAAAKMQNTLSSMLFLDPHPSKMRGYSDADDRELSGDGANVSAVLAKLCEQGKLQEEVLRFVRALPEQNIKEVDFLRTPRNEVMVRLVETFGATDRPVDAAVLSDGTLRVLAVAAAILSVPSGALVVIEEIDNGVHPSRASTLMNALNDVAKQRGIQLLVTTHNPALLDAVPLDAIGDTLACYRDPQDGRSRLQRLSDMDEFVALVAQGTLGWLTSSGKLDRFLKKPRSPAERSKDLEKTLALLRTESS